MGTPHCQPRVAAIAAGAGYYFTGKPCRNGHVANRYTASSTCVECARIRAADQRSKQPVAYAAYQAIYRTQNRVSLSAKRRASWAALRAAGVPRKPASPEARQAESQRHYTKHRDKINARVRRDRPRFRGRDNALSRAKKARRLQAMPPWADWHQIKAIYAEAARLGRHVDHVIPLKHPLVCGLHVPANMQLLTPVANMRKRNRFNPADFDWYAPRRTP